MADLSLGGVSAAELVSVTQDLGIPTDAGSSLITRFSRRVSDLVVQRAGAGDAGTYSIFLHSEALREEIEKRTCEEAPLLANGGDPVTDCVWLSSASLAAVFKLSFTWSNASELFTEIRVAGLGDNSAVVIDWRHGSPIGKLYRKGINNMEEVEEIFFEDLPIVDADLKAVLDRFYETSLRTPSLSTEGHAKKVWGEAPKGVPDPRPEETIQGRLLDVLKGVFARHELRAEPVTPDGRADIIIYKRALTSSNQPATVTEWVLELKALADRTATNNAVPQSTVRNAVHNGVEQVVAYRNQLFAINTALCCYDMRKLDEGDDKCFGHVAAIAAAENVRLWRWYLFRSTSASRAAKDLLKEKA